MEWKSGITLGTKKKEFKWKYSGYDGLTIIRAFKNGDNKTEFSNTDIEKIINYIKGKGRVPLANSVGKLTNGTEKDGFGSFIYEYISRNTADAQASSQLVSILYSAGVIGYNGATLGMEFWILDENWKEKLRVQKDN